MNLCTHCTHYHRTLRGDPMCIRDSSRNPVNGAPCGTIYHCHAERDQSGACGPNGQHFVLAGKFSDAVRDSLKCISSPLKCRAEVIDGGVGGTVGDGCTHESPDQLGIAFSEAIAELTVDFINRLAQQRAGGFTGLPKDSVVE